MDKINNKGVTYIELLVVVAVMSLMVAFSAITMGTVNRNNVARARDEVISSINGGRAKSLTSGTDNGWCNFTVKNGDLYCYNGSQVKIIDSSKQNWNKVFSKQIRLEYDSAVLGEGEILNLSFKQSTGEFAGYHVSTMDDVNKIETGPLELKVTNGNKEMIINVNDFGKIN